MRTRLICLYRSKACIAIVTIVIMLGLWLPSSTQVVYAQSPETRSPTANSGTGWTNPTNAYADGTSAATILSNNPSGNNVWGTYGFSLSGATITQVRVRYDAWCANSIPTYVDASPKSAGTGAVTPDLPTGLAANDIVILLAVTIAGGSITITADGSVTPWTAISGSPIDVASGDKLYVWWGRYSSGSTGPTVTPGGDHICASTIAYRGCITTESPIDISATGTETSSDTSFSFATGISTTVNNCLIFVLCSTGYDFNTGQFPNAFTNGNLSSVTNRRNHNTNSGDGGGYGGAEGGLATAGAIGTWATTLSNASPKAYICFALKPDPPNDQIRVDVSWDGGSSWSSKQTTALNGSEATYWYDVTGATAWTPEKLANGQLQVRADAQTVNFASTVSLDWIPVEVTYTVTPGAELNRSTWEAGTLDVNTTTNTAINYFTVTNTGGGTIDIEIKGTDATGGNDTWTLSDTGSAGIGENIFALYAGLDDADDSFDILIKKNSPYNTLVAGLIEDATQDFGIKLYMPTSVTGYDGQVMTSTVTLIVSAS